MLQLQLFKHYIVDELGPVGGITGARSVRASDSLNYIVKDEGGGVATVRAADYLWLSVARLIGLAAPTPEIIEDRLANRMLLGTRREQNAVGRDHASCLAELLTGAVHNGGEHLSRIFAFDLFCSNWDRHPGNYLVLDEGGVRVVFAIDFSHVALIPDHCPAAADPVREVHNATRAFFPVVVQPYGPDAAAAIDTINRLAALSPAHIHAILGTMPDQWLAANGKQDIADWWANGARAARLTTITNGLGNGTYF
jgi:hypothetical protein